MKFQGYDWVTYITRYDSRWTLYPVYLIWFNCIFFNETETKWSDIHLGIFISKSWI